LSESFGVPAGDGKRIGPATARTVVLAPVLGGISRHLPVVHSAAVNGQGASVDHLCLVANLLDHGVCLVAFLNLLFQLHDVVASEARLQVPAIRDSACFSG